MLDKEAALPEYIYTSIKDNKQLNISAGPTDRLTLSRPGTKSLVIAGSTAPFHDRFLFLDQALSPRKVSWCRPPPPVVAPRERGGF
jgi:hypothetical protein